MADVDTLSHTTCDCKYHVVCRLTASRDVSILVAWRVGPMAETTSVPWAILVE